MVWYLAVEGLGQVDSGPERESPVEKVVATVVLDCSVGMRKGLLLRGREGEDEGGWKPRQVTRRRCI